MYLELRLEEIKGHLDGNALNKAKLEELIKKLDFELQALKPNPAPGACARVMCMHVCARARGCAYRRACVRACLRDASATSNVGWRRPAERTHA